MTIIKTILYQQNCKLMCDVCVISFTEALHVYKNKSEAMDLVKKYKLARFKAFRNRQDALSFALRGAEITDTTDGNDNCKYFTFLYTFKICFNNIEGLLIFSHKNR